MDKIKLMIGDNIQSLKNLEDNSVDSVVTDPPYALTPSKNAKGGFMGKLWDAEVPSVEFWQEVYRVLKPGGHVLSFGGTRTYHRMVVNIEDAGFEIRDQIMWLYGSGFPKSHNIGKAVDKLEGNEREIIGVKENWLDTNNRKEGDRSMYDSAWGDNKRVDLPITKGSSEYEGWGTALKPANEPICLARKPLSEKSVAENVLKWGTGGINVDGCRIGFNNEVDKQSAKPGSLNATGENSMFGLKSGNEQNDEGRFPANLILECICDEVIKGEKGEVKKSNNDKTWNSDLFGERKEGDHYTDKGDIHTNPMCPCRLLDEQSGVSKSSKSIMGSAQSGNNEGRYNWNNGDKNDFTSERGHNDKGGASRFFYQAKVSKKERNMGLSLVEGKEVIRQGLAGEKNNPVHKNSHPTVKPITLMSYLCRLITPQGGIVLDPFMGSGSTGIAARLEGFDFIGMEMDEDYVKIASSRIENFEKYREFLNKK